MTTSTGRGKKASSYCGKTGHPGGFLFAFLVAAFLAWPGVSSAFLKTGVLLTMSVSASYTAGMAGTTVTYSATSKILVANPAMFLWKEVTPTMVSASAGGIVSFTICFSNGGATTAFLLTIKDKLSNNTYYLDNYSSWYVDLAGTPITTLPMTYSTDGFSWFPAQPPVGTGAPLWLQWVVPSMGVGRSGCIFFAASVGA